MAGREGRRLVIAVRPHALATRPPGIPDLSIRQKRVTLHWPRLFRSTWDWTRPRPLPSASTSPWRRWTARARGTGKLIMLISPTGTGYVNYAATAAAEYLTRGDIATVTLQYSKRPSPLSLGKIAGAREQNRLLWSKIAARVRDSPPDSGRELVLFGESLGAHTSQDVFIHWGTLG